MSEKTDAKTWSDLIGFEKERAQFSQLVKEELIPPVILFEGRAGIGKSLFTRYVASLFFCQAGTGCGGCSSCKEIIQNSHDEIMIFDPEGETLKVKDAREVLEHLETEPAARDSQIRPRRIVILNDVDLFTEEALNLLLKTVEEPPSHSLILMSTSRTYAILQTILSRAINWHLGPASKEKIITFIESEIGRRGTQLPAYIKVGDLVEQHGLAIGNILKSLEESNKLSALSEEIRNLLDSRSAYEALAAAEKIASKKDLSFNKLITQIEFFLTKRYRENIRLGKKAEIKTIKERRQLLSSLSKLAVQKRIALNLRLGTEALGLIPYASRRNT